MQLKNFVTEQLELTQNDLDSEGKQLFLFKYSKISAVDMRFLGEFEKNENGKLQTCANKVSEIYNQTINQKSTQAIFSDTGILNTENNFHLYKEIENELIKLGIPKDEIAFARNFKTKELADKIKNGDIRVVIGSTKTLGKDLDIKNELSAVHHIDVPKSLSVINQRENICSIKDDKDQPTKII